MRHASAPASTPAASPDISHLARENALISAAVTALRAGDTAAATRLLDQHAHEFPSGFLRAERETAQRRVRAAIDTASQKP
jgi:hypothetical protein